MDGSLCQASATAGGQAAPAAGAGAGAMPAGKVEQLPDGSWRPLLVYRQSLVPLGKQHACQADAQCAYDVGKLLVRAQPPAPTMP